MRQKTLNSRTVASSPGSISLSMEKLKKMRPELFGFKAWLNRAKSKASKGYDEIRELQEHLQFGDSQPAVVISKQPLMIAAYTEDIDCVALLKFPDEYAEWYSLEEKSRLITVNLYRGGESFQWDITPGPNCHYTWSGFYPIIGEFLTDDLEVLEEKKAEIEEEWWGYVYELGVAYSNKPPKIWRDGTKILRKEFVL